MKKLDFFLDQIEGILCTLFASVMAVAILIQVINRNTLQLPFKWGEELARYCMVWLMFIGISVGVKKGAHIGVDALVNILPPKIKKAIQIITNLIVTFIYVYLAILSVQITLGIRETGQVSPAMQVPMYIIYAGLIVGMIFSTIRSIQVTANCIAGKTRQDPDADFSSQFTDEISRGGDNT